MVYFVDFSILLKFSVVTGNNIKDFEKHLYNVGQIFDL